MIYLTEYIIKSVNSPSDDMWGVCVYILKMTLMVLIGKTGHGDDDSSQMVCINLRFLWTPTPLPPLSPFLPTSFLQNLLKQTSQLNVGSLWLSVGGLNLDRKIISLTNLWPVLRHFSLSPHPWWPERCLVRLQTRHISLTYLVQSPVESHELTTTVPTGQVREGAESVRGEGENCLDPGNVA